MPDRDADWERQHLHVLLYDDTYGIGMCGCGWPDDAYLLVRTLLDQFATWEGRDGIVERIGSAGAAQIILRRLQEADLIDHGTSVTGSWLTAKGKYARWLMRRHSMRDIRMVGEPECFTDSEGDCPAECWTAPDGVLPPDPLEKSLSEISETIRREADEARARMSPAGRASADAAGEMMTNMLLYGQHPAPETPPTGAFGGLLGAGDAPALGYVLPPATVGDPLWDAMLYGPPPGPEPTGAGAHKGLFDALGGVTPASAGWPTGPDATARTFDWVLRTDEAANGPLGRAKWAPAGCICPWPWPTAGGHVRLGCPHYAAVPKPIVGRNPRIGCRKADASWIHGRPHDCPPYARG